MELTAEQKFLKAIAEHFNQRSNPPYPFSIVMAAVGYLSEIDIIEDGKKVEFHGCDHTMPDPITGELPMGKVKFGDSLTWKPKVGELITLKENNELVYEIQTGDEKDNFWLQDVTGYATSEHVSIDEIACIFTPISELEGLKEGEHAYTYGDDGNIHSFVNEGKFQFHDFITVRNTQGGYCFNITLDGYFTILSNKQLFYRTADRAERFGRLQK